MWWMMWRAMFDVDSALPRLLSSPAAKPVTRG